jgi:hypothetical protein
MGWEKIEAMSAFRLPGLRWHIVGLNYYSDINNNR